jgi:spore maturation protein CgeB
VLWVISHPDDLTIAECDEADLILVASSRFAEELRSRTSTPVEVLLQATDHHRFRPLLPDPQHHHDVVAVAKTRDVPRPVVMDAIAAGIRPAIFGSGWEAFVDPSLVVSNYVPNNELPRLYASAGVVLNDHWASMRDAGFVSNRLFDVLACGTPVISDDLPELADLFDGAVLAYRSSDELATNVDGCLRNPDAARRRAEQGRDIVLAAHTFDHRVVELEQHLRRHALPGADG